MMAWPVKPGQAYLSKDGIRQIKSTLTNQIFKQEMLHLYEQKSESRDELVQEMRNAMLELSQQKEFRAIKTAVIQQGECTRQNQISFEDKDMEDSDGWVDDRELTWACWELCGATHQPPRP